jgi:hypothetical protein
MDLDGVNNNCAGGFDDFSIGLLYKYTDVVVHYYIGLIIHHCVCNSETIGLTSEGRLERFAGAIQWQEG